MKISEQFSLDSSASRTTDAPLIYVVDDFPWLAELYTLVLEESGYKVRAFTDRAAALAALKYEDRKPEILITDYINDSMPVERFISDCREAHPDLWILMVSGFTQVGGPILALRPDRFLEKPFAPEELRRRVQDGLEEVSSETFRARKKSCGAR